MNLLCEEAFCVPHSRMERPTLLPYILSLSSMINSFISYCARLTELFYKKICTLPNNYAVF